MHSLLNLWIMAKLAADINACCGHCGQLCDTDTHVQTSVDMASQACTKKHCMSSCCLQYG